VKPGWAGILAAILSFAGCQQQAPKPPALTANPHYVLGQAYQAGDHWYYPSEAYALDTTGIAAVQPAGPPRLTADGEIDDGTALTAAMQTIQLPAIVTVTNLDSGRQIDLRVNDRGPPDPARLIAVSHRAATLLQIPANGAARIRVQANTALSHRLTEQVGGGPPVEVASAPPAAVTAQTLPPPGATTAAGRAERIGLATAAPTGPPVPDRLPEQVRLVPIQPAQLWLRAGSFGRFDYANQVSARLAGLAPDVVRSRDGRQEVYAVRAGPYPTIPAADAALRSALARGVVDARITVE
jgi:rare lipoprotein A